MSESIKNSKLTLTIFVVLILMSVIADIASIFLGVAWGKGGFLTKLNWSLYPIFFILAGFLVYASWSLYLDAWQSLPKNSVLYRSGKIELNDSSLTPLIWRLNSYRKYLIVISILLGGLLTILDAGCLWSEYGVISGAAQCEERDFSVAYTMISVYPDANKLSNGMFNILVYFLQGGLIAAGWLTFLQMTLHGYYFWQFEKTKEAVASDYQLRLNIHDPLHEFGITELNRALNTIYITIALAMIIPVASAASQQPIIPDFGQWLLRILLPLLLLAPLVIPTIDRYFRLKEASDFVMTSPNENDAKDFREQKLWPFEGTQIGYLGKAAAALGVTEYAYLFSHDIMGLIK